MHTQKMFFIPTSQTITYTATLKHTNNEIAKKEKMVLVSASRLDIFLAKSRLLRSLHL